LLIIYQDQSPENRAETGAGAAARQATQNETLAPDVI
jgi:hypothetical protein